MNTSVDQDKKGDALKQQRFRMLEDIAAEISSEVVFPTYFDAVVRLRNELRNPDVSTERIVSLVRAEPLVSARLLHLANAAAQGNTGEIRDLGKAIVRLGVNTVRTTALTVAMTQLVRSKELVPFSDLSRTLWQHSVFTAAAASVIARELAPRINPDEALTAGLLHDLGAFYMLYRAAQYHELRARPDTVRYLISQWHESIGESLLFALQLPESLIEAIRDHDTPRDLMEHAPHTLSDVVYAANALGRGAFEWREESGQPRLLGQRYLDLNEQVIAEFNALRAEYAA